MGQTRLYSIYYIPYNTCAKITRRIFTHWSEGIFREFSGNFTVVTNSLMGEIVFRRFGITKQKKRNYTNTCPKITRRVFIYWSEGIFREFYSH